MKIITVANQKGGVGKSTSVLNMGAGLSLRGRRVLFVDLDAQRNLSHTLDTDGSIGSMEVIRGVVSARRAVQQTALGDVIPGSPDLAGADALITATGKEYRLREALEPLKAMYDYAIIDTPPALGILTVNALAASAGCVIPAQADIYSLQGIGQLYETIDAVRKYCNPSLRVMGILLTRYNGRAVIGREVAEMIEQTAVRLDTKLYAAKIRECTAIKESQAVKNSIFNYAPKSNAAVDYNDFIDEILREE